MENLRKQIIANISSRTASSISYEKRTVEELYGEDVFSLKTMKDYLPKPVYKSLLSTIRLGKSIDSSIADEVANAMKRWAINKGASHYTHWFQPLTGSTAEKHDSFIEPDLEGGVMLDFSGKTLIQGEPDASSFPSGGLRATFEARGYTVWDPTSPAFIKRGINNATLCIPTAFYSYTGEALDKKIPLLRSMQAISVQGKRLLKCFGVEISSRIHTTLGAEQEYFLIDKELYYARPDLIQCERTVFGCEPSKHQQLDDHYFGSIKPRVLAYMSEVDKKLWRLGIPAKTRHNEVAPSQFEIAAQYEELNLATDHNMLIMETLEEVADKHGLVCLLHEKPFARLNGSGKHNNWSISANGDNLLNPGKDPQENAIFLTVLCAIIQAIDKHPALLRSTVANAGNVHRLGANEAPPPIISIFLGEQLTDIIEQLETGNTASAKKAETLKIGIDTIPVLPKDTTDRNRTSPFAFTGNKFEFRAVGSSQNCAGPNVTLNTIVAEAFDEIATKLEPVAGTDKFNETLQSVLQDIIRKHKKVIFNGDNYSEGWIYEAEKRGLPNIMSVSETLKEIISEESINVFEKYNVLSKKELFSRYEVYKENFETRLNIEGQVGLYISKTIVTPAVIEYQSSILKNLKLLTDTGIGTGTETIREKAEYISSLLDDMSLKIKDLEKIVESRDPEEIAVALANLRLTVDTIEREIDDKLWPLPKYSEMLFIS
ncbi:MAG: glutamine synthetase III [Victivallales bacterium]|nr:glutamine synthetase III [Victivallales bacterium]MCF7888661.1 glutamine synthetase III [Victivallales bacterium]